MKSHTQISAAAFIAATLCMLVSPFAQVASAAADTGTANDFSTYVQYTGLYGYGSNMGYYGQQFTDQDVSQLAYNVGSRTVRPSLPDWLITGYGTDARVTAFQFYQTLGMKDLTVFVGEPNNAEHGTGGPDDRETKQFPGTDERARTFKGLYEPVWLDAAKTQINPANTFANYLYKTVKTYGANVKYWEIVNEPDFTYTSAGWEDASAKDSWWNVNPNPQDLSNLKAPIYYYIRELRVAWDVIKTLQPNEYVCTGGIGYASFLDALMRNTDNPVDGSVTADYPLKGGAYFDVLSYHTYPMYSLRHWDNTIGDFVYTRYSDSAVDVMLGAKKDFTTVLNKYGYNGTTYPNKQWIITETDLPQSTVGDVWGSADSARNYILKAHIEAQANGIEQIYKYGLGESDDTGNPSFNVMGVYGNLSPSTTTLTNAPKTEEFKAIKTISDALYGKTYDASRTAQLSLPSTVRGAAFKDASGNYTYALWAATSTDKSESASATYTFPFSFSGTRYEWDHSATNASTSASQTVALTGSPSFFVAGASSANTGTYVPPPLTPYVPSMTVSPSNVPPRAYAGTDVNVALSTASASTAATELSGSGTDQDGFISSYAWSQISGPSTAIIGTPYAASTSVLGLVSGTYYFRLTVTDNRGAIASDDVAVSVSGRGRVRVTASSLNVRRTAGGTLIARVPYGKQGLVTDQVTYKGAVWDKVAFDGGITGWVSALYIALPN